MSFVIGRRHGRETYPLPPGIGGAQAALVPLTRQRFIDGGTVQTGRDGSVARPYLTIAEFTASRTKVSAGDSSANYVGWLTPKIGGYVENVSFPAGAATEIRADSYTPQGSATIDGTLNWTNTGGANDAIAPTATAHNCTVTGVFQVTDDIAVPSSAVIFGADEFGLASAVLVGGFVSNTTVRLATATFYNALVAGAGIDAGSTGDSAAVAIISSIVAGAGIAARSLSVVDSSLDVPIITTSDSAVFKNVDFTAGGNPVLTSGGTAFFDGPSWISFLEAGGTRAAGTIVLVKGGYNGGDNPGAALPTTGQTNVSLNGTGATAGYTGEDSGNHYSVVSDLTGDAEVQLLTGGGELAGDTMLITRVTTGGAFTLTVFNNAGATIGEIPVSSQGFILAEIPPGGTDWVLAQCGYLPAGAA